MYDKDKTKARVHRAAVKLRWDDSYSHLSEPGSQYFICGNWREEWSFIFSLDRAVHTCTEGSSLLWAVTMACFFWYLDWKRAFPFMACLGSNDLHWLPTQLYFTSGLVCLLPKGLRTSGIGPWVCGSMLTSAGSNFGCPFPAWALL